MKKHIEAIAAIRRDNEGRWWETQNLVTAYCLEHLTGETLYFAGHSEPVTVKKITKGGGFRMSDGRLHPLHWIEHRAHTNERDAVMAHMSELKRRHKRLEEQARTVAEELKRLNKC